MVAKKKPTSAAKRTSSPKSHRTTKKSQEVVYRTFQVAPDFPTFLQARVTKQTFYWSFLLLVIVILQLLILATNYDATLTLDVFSR